MTNYKNDLPLYAEQITVNQEVEQIQQVLSQFKQPVPSNFIELAQLNWMCSTQNWKEPVCERYNCLIKDEWKQVDIRHDLLEGLGLTKNIPYPVHISSVVLDKGLDRYFAYNVKDEKEIFLQKPFTVQNLEKDINKLFEIIANLEKELEKETQSFTHELKGEKQLGQSQKEFYRKKIQYLKDQLNQIQNKRDALPILPTLNDYLLLQTERDNLQITITQLNNLIREKDQELTTKNTQIANLNTQLNTANAQKLTLDEQNAITWTSLCLTALNNALVNANTSYLDSYQSYFNPNGVFHSSITGGLTKYGRMNSIVNNLINTWNQTRNQINSRNSLITSHQSQISSLNSQLTTTRNELKKEQEWWDKWINDWGSSFSVWTVNGSSRLQVSYKVRDARFGFGETYQIKDFLKEIYQYYRDK